MSTGIYCASDHSRVFAISVSLLDVAFCDQGAIHVTSGRSISRFPEVRRIDQAHRVLAAPLVAATRAEYEKQFATQAEKFGAEKLALDI